jgi:hypothetical protein
MGGRKDDRAGDGVGRRRFLVAAAGAGAAAWAVPAIITMEPAGASGLTSPPPKPSQPPATSASPPPEVLGTEVVKDPAAAPGSEVAGATAAGGQLPFTGAKVEQLTIAGLAATAGGAAMHFWSAGTPKPGASGASPTR